MDKAPVFGTGDCGFESHRAYFTHLKTDYFILYIQYKIMSDEDGHNYLTGS